MQVSRSTSQPPVSSPSRHDPVVRALSDRWGGPAGRRLRQKPQSFWSIQRVLVALTVLGVLLSFLASQYCRINGWDGVGVYHAGCYSDVAALWTTREFSESAVAPFSADHTNFEYPVLTMALASATAAVTHWMHRIFGDTPLAYWGESGSLLFFDLTFLSAAAAWLLLVLITLRIANHRPWDATVLAISPAIIFSIGINWDIWAAVALAGAVLAYQRSWWWVCGVLIGIGVSFKLYPLFMLGAAFTMALRRHLRSERDGLQWEEFGRVVAGAAGSWLIINIPVIIVNMGAWVEFFSFSAERGAGYSSLWHLWNELADTGIVSTAPGPQLISWLSFGVFFLCCLAVLGVGVLASQRPRVEQLLFLIVAGFLLCNKVYSPQFMIWLLPLIVLAAPRVRDLIIWHIFQLLHFWAVWMYLAEQRGEYEVQHTFDPSLYLLAVVGHMASTVYIMGQVVADIRRPSRDVVRRPAHAG